MKHENLLCDLNNKDILHAICKKEIDEYINAPKKIRMININKKKIKKIKDVIIKNPITFPIIPKLSFTVPIFYWFNGDKINSRGAYARICDNIVCKIPFPDLYDSSNKNFKKKTIQCKYYDDKICLNNRARRAKIDREHIKECYFTHKNEKFNRLGNLYRCSVESFGNHETLNADLEKIKMKDIKLLLTSSLGDLLLVQMWLQKNFKDNNKLVVLDNIDVC